MIKIDCKKYADGIIEQVKQTPNKKKLAILTAGDDPASAAYMRGKMKDCERCNIPVQQIKAESQEELMSTIKELNIDPDVGGIIVQLPLPKGFGEQTAVHSINSEKDVDGFKTDSPFMPCTPEGILYIIENEIGDLAGKQVLLIGKGKLVGRPLINILINRGCTLTIANSKTKDLTPYLQFRHDVVITAVGKPKLVDLLQVNADVVVDAGISRDENGKLCGDCYNFREDEKQMMRVTTVPGGVGLLTRAMLMSHME